MAVQAQYPSNIPVGDFCMSRARQSYGNGGVAANGGAKNMNGFVYASAAPPAVEDIQFHLMNPASSALINPIMGGGGAPPIQQQQQHQQGLQQFTDELIYNVPNKRPRVAEYVPVNQHPLPQQQQQQQHHQQQQQAQHQQHQQQQQQQQQQAPQIVQVQDFHHRSQLARAPVVPGAPPNVSTGLRLAFPDDRLSSTAPSGVPKIDLNSSTGQTLSLLSEEIAIELQRQRDEIEQLIRVQEEQMRRVIEEKQQQQARALIGSLERFVARKLREKDMELEKMSRRNMELEERVKQVTVEARVWQTKAKNGEAMVASLRNNLQQAVVLSREQSKEGVGDTADDAESSYPDDTADVHARTFKENKELREKRTCRVCRSNDVCILLLPCRHLCLCKECEARLDTCPLCRNPKNASVQVYMS